MTETRRRQLLALAAAASAVVALVFLTIGDGVDVPSATGVRKVVIDYGHTAVWILLAVAFAIAAIRGRWKGAAAALAVAALVVYAAFLACIFLPG